MSDNWTDLGFGPGNPRFRWLKDEKAYAIFLADLWMRRQLPLPANQATSRIFPLLRALVGIPEGEQGNGRINKFFLKTKGGSSGLSLSIDYEGALPMADDRPGRILCSLEAKRVSFHAELAHKFASARQTCTLSPELPELYACLRPPPPVALPLPAPGAGGAAPGPAGAAAAAPPGQMTEKESADVMRWWKNVSKCGQTREGKRLIAGVEKARKAAGLDGAEAAGAGAPAPAPAAAAGRGGQSRSKAAASAGARRKGEEKS